MDAIDPATLVTVAGASAAAIIITQFAKQLLDLSRQAIRRVSLLTGLLVVEGATLVDHWPDIVDNTTEVITTVFIAAIVGAQAGLATNAAFDKVDAGSDYEVYPSSENVGEGH